MLRRRCFTHSWDPGRVASSGVADKSSSGGNDIQNPGKQAFLLAFSAINRGETSLLTYSAVQLGPSLVAPSPLPCFALPLLSAAVLLVAMWRYVRCATFWIVQ